MLFSSQGAKVSCDKEQAISGPTTLNSLRSIFGFMRDPLAFFSSMAREYGHVVRYHLGTWRMLQITDPELLEDVLVKKQASFHKDKMSQELRDMLGQGLLISEGELWKRQRRLAAPPLKRKQIANYADAMVHLTEKHLLQWQDSEIIDLHRESTELTLRIAVKTLFGMEINSDVDAISRAVETYMHAFHLEVHTPWRLVPPVVPTEHRREKQRAVEILDAVVYELIDKRRSSLDEGHDDLLSHLLRAQDDDGSQMSDKQLRDEVLTMFLAGHETTALVLTFSWMLLSQNPECARKLHQEVEQVLGQRSASADDMQALAYTRAVILESMRLYPPAWAIGRQAIEDVVIGSNLHVSKGTQVLIPQWVLHRDKRWFENPEQFTPERWLGGLEKELPRNVYMPFGGGARICIGNHFAMMEAILVIATMAQQFRFIDVSQESLTLQPSITLRPTSTISMKVERHEAAPPQ